MTTQITDPETAGEAERLVAPVVEAGHVLLSRLGFEMTEPAEAQIAIGTDQDPDHAVITLTWPLPPEVAPR